MCFLTRKVNEMTLQGLGVIWLQHHWRSVQVFVVRQNCAVKGMRKLDPRFLTSQTDSAKSPKPGVGSPGAFSVVGPEDRVHFSIVSLLYYVGIIICHSAT